MRVRVRLTEPEFRRWPIGRFGVHPFTGPASPGLRGLRLNRLGDRRRSDDGRLWRKGCYVIGCWVTFGDRYVSWVWPIQFVIDRLWAREPGFARLADLLAEERRSGGSS